MNYEIINRKKAELGITNAYIAEKTGISPSTIDKITSGKKQNPTLDTLQAIADVIGCTIDDFRDTPSQLPSLDAMDIARDFDLLNDDGKEMMKAAIAFAKKHFLISNP